MDLFLSGVPFVFVQWAEDDDSKPIAELRAREQSGLDAQVFLASGAAFVGAMGVEIDPESLAHLHHLATGRA